MGFYISRPEVYNGLTLNTHTVHKYWLWDSGSINSFVINEYVQCMFCKEKYNNHFIFIIAKHISLLFVIICSSKAYQKVYLNKLNWVKSEIKLNCS